MKLTAKHIIKKYSIALNALKDFILNFKNIVLKVVEFSNNEFKLSFNNVLFVLN